MVCEWFTWEPGCDLPNWLALLIGGLIGMGITAYFSIRQRIEKKKKKRLALQRIADIYDNIEDQISVLEGYENEDELEESFLNNPKILKKFQDKREYYIYWRNETLKNVEGWASHLDEYIILFSEDLDQGMKAITKFLIFTINRLRKTLDDDSRYKSTLKDVIEVNRCYNNILTNIKPNPREDFADSIKNWPDESEGWEVQMNHLYFGKVKNNSQ